MLIREQKALMRILFITQFYPPEMGAAAARIAGLAKNLAKLGHGITVLTGFPNYPSGIIHKEYQLKLFLTKIVDGISLNRVWVFASPLRKFLTRLLNYFSLVFTSILFEIFNTKDYEVVIVSSPPLFLGISGYAISRLKGSKFVLDIRDIWPKIGVDTGELRKDSLPIKIAEWLEYFLYQNADLITVVTERKSIYLQELGIPVSKISVIPNGVDREYLETEADKTVVEENFNDNCFSVLYAGLLGIAQGVDVIIKAANILKEQHDIKFFIIGDGVEKKYLIELVEDNGLENVTFIENQPKEKIATFLKNCDVSVIPLKKADFSDSVPSKLLESMAFGCPVILSASGESASIVESSEGGLVVKPGDEKELANAILKLKRDSDLRDKFAKNGELFIKNNFMRDKIVEEFEKVLMCKQENII